MDEDEKGAKEREGQVWVVRGVVRFWLSSALRCTTLNQLFTRFKTGFGYLWRLGWRVSESAIVKVYKSASVAELRTSFMKCRPQS